MSMNDDPTLEQFVHTIAGACERLVDDFERLRVPLQQLHPEWSVPVLAANLMEFGRGQISGIDEPTQADREFIARYAHALAIPGDVGRLFCAYASGCLMGWVATGELSQDQLVDALQVAQQSALRIYPEDAD
jgi:hypothetical protein